jgi:hypothetical protein
VLSDMKEQADTSVKEQVDGVTGKAEDTLD